MRRFAICLLGVALVAAGCAKPAAVPLKPADDFVGTAAAIANQISDLFPDGDWQARYHFDDGTPDTQEWWHRADNVVTESTANSVLATWYITPDGLYRRDPLGGKDGALLRYLPAKLTDNTAWQQKSGDSTVEFWLAAVPQCGAYTNCWELVILNRDQRQQFDFAPGHGVVTANTLAFKQPGASFHKTLMTGAPTEPAPNKAAEQVPAFDPGLAPAVAPLSLATFQSMLRTFVATFAHKTALPDGTQAWVIEMPDGSASPPAMVFQGDMATSWERRPAVCQYQQVQQPTPFVLQVCPNAGRPLAYRVMAWYTKDGKPAYYWWPQHPATTKALDADAVAVYANGDVALTLKLTDPAGHAQVTTYRLDKEVMRQASITYSPAAGELKYPETPGGVLEAAFFARFNNLSTELPRYFTAQTSVGEFVRADLKNYVAGGVTELKIGRLTPDPDKNANRAPVMISPVKVAADQPYDFLVETAGCCDSWGAMSGTVTFTQEGGQWKIKTLEIQTGYQPGKPPTPIAKPN